MKPLKWIIVQIKQDKTIAWGNDMRRLTLKEIMIISLEHIPDEEMMEWAKENQCYLCDFYKEPDFCRIYKDGPGAILGAGQIPEEYITGKVICPDCAGKELSEKIADRIKEICKCS